MPMSSPAAPPPTNQTSRWIPVPVARQPDPPEKLVRIMAGTVTLAGLALGFFVSPWGYLLTAFAGLNIFQSAFTGFCPPEMLYRWVNQPASRSSAESARPGHE